MPCVSRSAHRLAILVSIPGSVFAREGDLPSRGEAKRRNSQARVVQLRRSHQPHRMTREYPGPSFSSATGLQIRQSGSVSLRSYGFLPVHKLCLLFNGGQRRLTLQNMELLPPSLSVTISTAFPDYMAETNRCAGQLPPGCYVCPARPLQIAGLLLHEGQPLLSSDRERFVGAVLRPVLKCRMNCWNHLAKAVHTFTF